MNSCFCGKSHEGNVYIGRKCSICSREKERALWDWLQENGHTQFVHNYGAYCLTTSDGKHLLYDFLGENTIIEIEHLGCSNNPHNDLQCNLFYFQQKDFHCSHSENRYKYKIAVSNACVRYIIKFPGELCSEEHFHKIERALQMINEHKYTDGYSPLIILIKNGPDDDRYRYLSNPELLFERRDIQIRTIE